MYGQNIGTHNMQMVVGYAKLTLGMLIQLKLVLTIMRERLYHIQYHMTPVNFLQKINVTKDIVMVVWDGMAGAGNNVKVV